MATAEISIDREQLGRLVRRVWVKYCHETGDTKPSHIAPWEELPEHDREADRRIGEVVALHVLTAVGAAIDATPEDDNAE